MKVERRVVWQKIILFLDKILENKVFKLFILVIKLEHVKKTYF